MPDDSPIEDMAQYSLTFDGNARSDAVNSLPAFQTFSHVSIGEGPTPDPTRSGYTFEGWYTDVTGITAWIRCQRSIQSP